VQSADFAPITAAADLKVVTKRAHRKEALGLLFACAPSTSSPTPSSTARTA
jgi:hypothetical protein